MASDRRSTGRGVGTGRFGGRAWAVILLAAGSVATLEGADIAAAQTPAAKAPDAAAPVAHGLAMHGALRYGPDFSHFAYADPEAPKGGDVTLAQTGSFDSLNPYILEGSTPYLVLEDRVYETLMTSALDEPFSMYGRLAATVQTPADRSWTVFTLRPEARWSDGSPVTADDVVFSFNTLREKGHPFYQQYYGDVDKVAAVDAQTVRFDTKAGVTNRELPLILGQVPIFQKAWWETRAFDQPSLEIPVSSGPYKVGTVDPGNALTLVRDPDYWGKDIPVAKGRYNFDSMRYDFYQDSDVALEAFKAGEYDYRAENSSKNWAVGYDFPALEEGKVVKEEIPNDNDQGMQGYWFNLRRPMFQDKRVREALILAFDFEWTNANLTYNAYTRDNSYFSNSELGSRGLPEAGELALLDPFKGQIPDEVFEREYVPPSTGGTEEGLRANLKEAVALLEAAGWTVKDNALVNAAGEPLRFEILLDTPGFERITGPYIDNLKKLGVDASMRTVDPSQYEKLTEDFDFDMIIVNRAQSESPGNEQRDYWTCEAAKTPGSGNYPGICDPAVDAMVDAVVNAADRQSLVTASRALDRVLLWGQYVVPQWHISHSREAYWKVIRHPDTMPNLGSDFDAWYADSGAAEAIRAAQEAIAFVQPTAEGATADAATLPAASTPAAAAGAAEPERAPAGNRALWTTGLGLLVLAAAGWFFLRRRGEV